MILISLQICVNMIKSDCMPKKSKSQKVIAAYHRKIKLLNLQSPTANVLPTKVIHDNKPKVNYTNENKEDMLIKKYFSADLNKSLFLIAVITVLEIGIYFVSINHYLIR